MIRVCRINKTRRLLAVHYLIKMSMKKGIFHIELMDRPMTRDCKAKNSPGSCRLHHRIESLVTINTMLLCKTSDNPAGLMASKRTIRMIFMLKNPLACNHIGP